MTLYAAPPLEVTCSLNVPIFHPENYDSQFTQEWFAQVSPLSF